MWTNASEPRPTLSAGPQASSMSATVRSIHVATAASTQSGKRVEFTPSLKPPRESKNHRISEGRKSRRRDSYAAGAAKHHSRLPDT